jgi:hypothetical protein
MKSPGLVFLALIELDSAFAAAGSKSAATRAGVNPARDASGWIHVVVSEDSFGWSLFTVGKMPAAPDVHHGLARNS